MKLFPVLGLAAALAAGLSGLAKADQLADIKARGKLICGTLGTSEPFSFQHPQTREIARCAEGYRSFMAGTGYRSMEDCIEDYQRRGYERMSGPASSDATR